MQTPHGRASAQVVQHRTHKPSCCDLTELTLFDFNIFTNQAPLLYSVLQQHMC